MRCTGTVRGGVVVFDHAAPFSEGAKVRIEPASTEEDEAGSLYDTLAPVVGLATDLPPDAARNIDRDLYGSNAR
jgi:hypothetical protein